MRAIFLTSMRRAIASLAVTLPSVYYLLQPQIERAQHPEKHGHGGHGGHDEHDEQGEEGEGNKEGGSSEEGEGGEGEPSEGKSDDSGSDDTGKDTPDTSGDEGAENTAHETEGGQDVEGVRFKGASSGGTGDTRKSFPDAKGFKKKRIESDYGGKQGEAQNPEQDPNDKDLVTIAPLHGVVQDGHVSND